MSTTFFDRAADRFMVGDGCWEWLSPSKRDGYGRLWANGEKRVVHRTLYQVLRGPVAEHLTLDHLCRNRACVRPSHLEVVTRGENVLRGDGIAARLARRKSCPRGHQFDDENTYWHTVRGHSRPSRFCRACRREQMREWYRKNRASRVN